jgi:hypothetical protein
MRLKSILQSINVRLTCAYWALTKKSIFVVTRDEDDICAGHIVYHSDFLEDVEEYRHKVIVEIVEEDTLDQVKRMMKEN